MKKLIFLLMGFFIWDSALSQIKPLTTDKNVGGFLSTNNGVIIFNRAYTGSTSDTVEVLNTLHHKTLYLNVFTKDSATVLIDYALSSDGANFGAFAVKDSLSNNTANNGTKSVDFSSTILGFQYVKFRLRFSANAFALGTTTATYQASYSWKKE